MKPVAGQVQRSVQQARDDVFNEAGAFARTAQSQVTGVEARPAIGQSTPQLPPANQFATTQEYWQAQERQNEARLAELRKFVQNIKNLDEEQKRAEQIRAQQEQAVAQAQAAQMQETAREENKSGNVLSRAVKRIKGRLGQVGKGKMEKGRGGTG